MQRLMNLGTILGLLALVSGCGGKGPDTTGKKPTTGSLDPAVLRVAPLPDQKAETLLQRYDGLKKYLEKETGKKVELVIEKDYATLIDRMARGDLELAYFGPVAYVACKERCEHVECFAAQQKNESATLRSVVIGNIAANINDLKDVKGKVMAYGDPASTSSHTIARAMLKDAGFEAGRDYEAKFCGTHDAAALAVQKGEAQMGCLNRIIFNALIEKGVLDKKKVKIVAVSKPFPNYPWALNSKLTPALQQKIRTAFYNLKDKDILKPLKADGFVPVTDRDYEVMRKLKEDLKLKL